MQGHNIREHIAGDPHLVVSLTCVCARGQFSDGDTAEFILLILHDFPHMLMYQCVINSFLCMIEHEDISISWLK